MLPTYHDHGGTAIFSSGQLKDYGLPENNGWSEQYLVVEEEVDSHPMEYTYKSLKDYDLVKEREIHRYCRISRFRGVLHHLMGMGKFSTRKSKERLDEISWELPPNVSYTPPCLLWNTFWKVLKDSKIKKCYNAIPTIINCLKLGEKTTRSVKVNTVYQKVMEDFRNMHNIFEAIKHEMKRSYFPSLRSIALMLLNRHGYVLPIKIPIARTLAKIERIEFDYQMFFSKLHEKEVSDTNDFFGF